MKKHLLFISLLFTAALNAQITVTSADMPNAGDSVLLSVTNSVGTADPTLTGASYNWDYSMLVPNLQRYDKFDSPLTFTSPFNLIFNVFNTSYGRDNNTITSLPIPGLTFNSAYDFLKESSSQLKQIGAGYTINSTPLPFYYTSSDVIYKFPMNYLNTDSSDYAFGLPIPTFGYYGEKGHRVNVVDGWGSVTTPYGTFNALRVKSTVSAVDSIYSSTFGFGTNIPRPLTYQYKWLANGKEIPVLEIDANDVGGTPTVTNVQYIDSIIPTVPHLGIAENKAATINSSAFPNPCVENIFVQYYLASKATIKISFTDVVGKTAATVLNETQASGTYQKTINIADLGLSPGVYFLILETNTVREVHKIVVGK